MGRLFKTEDPSSRLSGKLMRCFVSAVRKFEPGEKSVLSSLAMEVDVHLDYVVVPPDVAFDPDTSETRLFFCHEQIVPDVWRPGFGSRIPASLFFCRESAQVQKLDIFGEKLFFRAGETIDVGVFENVGRESLLVKAGIVVWAQDRRDDFKIRLNKRKVGT